MWQAHLCANIDIMPYRYNRTEIEKLVPVSSNVTDLLRKMGRMEFHSSTITLLGKRLREWGIDTSHFDFRRIKKGTPNNKRISPKERLICRSQEDTKTLAAVLRRCLIETGRDYVCDTCRQIPFWNNKLLVLQVHHKNGKNRDDRPENLEFICPNCHSQTLNYGVRNANYGKVAECFIASASKADAPQGVVG